MTAVDMPVGEKPKRGHFWRFRSGASKAAPSTGDTARDRRPQWLKDTDGLVVTTVVVAPSFSTGRAQRRRESREVLDGVQQVFGAVAAATRQDKAAVRRRAYLAGCHGKSVAPMSADLLRQRYGDRPTPAQARRIRKADHVEAGQ